MFFPGFSSYTSMFCVLSHESACHPPVLAAKPQPYTLNKISSDFFRLLRDCSCFYYMTSSMTLHWTLTYHLFTPNSLLRAAVCACSQHISQRLYPLNQQALLCCALSHLSCSTPGLYILNITDCPMTHTQDMEDLRRFNCSSCHIKGFCMNTGVSKWRCSA